MANPSPQVSAHHGVIVVRDDLFPGGTKARAIEPLFAGVEECVYAGPQQGMAQVALAAVAQRLGKRATAFVAKRADPHPRVRQVVHLGGKVLQVTPGHLTVVQKRAKDYARDRGAYLVPFGLNHPTAIRQIADAARALELDPDEVWCASGSGVLMRALAAAWPKARRFSVQVGRALSSADVAGAEIILSGRDFDDREDNPDFPSCPHYDAKAWRICKARHGKGTVVFWNVTGR
jgi:hypothetical protein